MLAFIVDMTLHSMGHFKDRLSESNEAGPSAEVVEMPPKSPRNAQQ